MILYDSIWFLHDFYMILHGFHVILLEILIIDTISKKLVNLKLKIIQ